MLLIPSAEELGAIANALRDFLATFEEFKPLLADQWNSIGAFILRPSMEECLRKLVRACNTRREQPPERRQIAAAGWPPVVMACVVELRPHVQDIISRWDVPEICEDRPIGPRGKGKFGQTQDDGTHVQQEINRLARPYTLQPEEVKRLAWIEGTFRAAIAPIAHKQDVDEKREASPENGPSKAELQQRPEGDKPPFSRPSGTGTKSLPVSRTWYEDPVIQAAWEECQANPPSMLPKPEAVMLGFLPFLLQHIEGPWPTVANEPDRYAVYHHIHTLVNAIPGISEFVRKLNSVLQCDLTVQGTLKGATGCQVAWVGRLLM